MLPCSSGRALLAGPDSVPGCTPQVRVPGDVLGALQGVWRDVALREVGHRIAPGFEEKEDLLTISDPGSAESHAHASASDVLDLVMQGRQYRLVDFGEHMLPPAPFALLVAEAMGDHMSAAEWETFTGPKADASLRATLQLQYALNVWPKFLERYSIS